MAPRIAGPSAPAHSNPIAKRSHTSQNDVCATRQTPSADANRGLSPESRQQARMTSSRVLRYLTITPTAVSWYDMGRGRVPGIGSDEPQLRENADRCRKCPPSPKPTLVASSAGGAYVPPFGMYAIMAPRIAAPRAPAHSNPIAKRSHTSHNDVCATRGRGWGFGARESGLAVSFRLVTRCY